MIIMPYSSSSRRSCVSTWPAGRLSYSTQLLGDSHTARSAPTVTSTVTLAPGSKPARSVRVQPSQKAVRLVPPGTPEHRAGEPEDVVGRDSGGGAVGRLAPPLAPMLHTVLALPGLSAAQSVRAAPRRECGRALSAQLCVRTLHRSQEFKLQCCAGGQLALAGGTPPHGSMKLPHGATRRRNGNTNPRGAAPA